MNEPLSILSDNTYDLAAGSPASIEVRDVPANGSVSFIVYERSGDVNLRDAGGTARLTIEAGTTVKVGPFPVGEEPPVVLESDTTQSVRVAVVRDDDGSFQVEPASGGGGAVRVQIEFSGRFYLNAINRWVTFDDALGPNLQNIAGNAQDGPDPAVSYLHYAFAVPAGATLKRITSNGRTTSAEVADIEVALIASYNAEDPGQNVSSDADLTNETAFRGTLFGAFSGDSTDRRQVIVDVDPEYTFTDEGSLIFYLRPVGTLTALRYFYAAFTIELEL